MPDKKSVDNAVPISLESIHAELKRAGGITGREAAALLCLPQIGINERRFRHYMTGRDPMPVVVFRALRDLAGELEALTDREWEKAIEHARNQY